MNCNIGNRDGFVFNDTPQQDATARGILGVLGCLRHLVFS